MAVVLLLDNTMETIFVLDTGSLSEFIQIAVGGCNNPGTLVTRHVTWSGEPATGEFDVLMVMARGSSAAAEDKQNIRGEGGAGEASDEPPPPPQAFQGV